MTDTKALDETLKYMNKCIQLGRFEPPNLADIYGTAALVANGTALPSDVLVKLKELEARIGTLAKKLTDDYDGLDVLMAKNLFYTDYIQKLLTITKFAQDTLFNPTQEGFDLLAGVYQKNDLSADAAQTISFMSLDNSNPIKVAMNADATKSNTTFVKWRDIVDGYLQHFLFVEAYLKRLVFGEDNKDGEELEKLIKELEKKYPEWEDAYRPDPFSDDVAAIVEHVQDMNVDNEARADILIDYLRRMFPKDTFHVLVFNEPTQSTDYASYALEGKQAKHFRHGKSWVVICRSDEYHAFTAEQVRDLRREVKNVGAIDLSGTQFESIPQKYMESFDALFGEKHGSMSVIQETQKLAVRVAPIPPGKAPGWSTKVSIRGSDGNPTTYSLIAVYK
ncbi:unnamed protein product [Caenorhabditis sp. 36 PRJEB53466]|nr:unnamed protein product [Caenorhabditis sp. 36 PRJEB53466]